MRRPRIIAKASIKEEDGHVHYKLMRMVLAGKAFYLIFISYNGECRLCTLDCKEKQIAADIFDSIVKTRSTPLSLCDSIYELQK